MTLTRTEREKKADRLAMLEDKCALLENDHRALLRRLEVIEAWGAPLKVAPLSEASLPPHQRAMRQLARRARVNV